MKALFAYKLQMFHIISGEKPFLKLLAFLESNLTGKYIRFKTVLQFRNGIRTQYLNESE